MASRSKRSHPPNAVTSSGPSQPHSRSLGIGADSRARSAETRPASSPAGAASPASVPIIGHMLLPPRGGGPAREREDTVMAQRDEQRDRAGVLTLAAVPIGRAEAASAGRAEDRAGAAVIAAEDPRRVRWLAASLGVTLSARVISYYDA